MNCQAQLEKQATFYRAAVFLSVALTVGVSVASSHCWRERLLDARNRHFFFNAMGATKMGFVVLIIFLVPSCPSGCVCGDFTSFYFYPAIAALIAFRWFSTAAAARREADAPVQHAVAVPIHDPDAEEAAGFGSAGGAQMVPMGQSNKNDGYKDLPIVAAKSSNVV